MSDVTTAEPSVESCLRELREMPDFNRARVEFTEFYDSSTARITNSSAW